MPHAPTGVVYHPDYLKHAMPAWHPERPERLTAIVEHLRETGLWDEVEHVEATPADARTIALVHAPGYIAAVEQVCERGGGLLDLGDTPVVRGSYEVACLAVGGVLRAADAVLAGRVRNAFCLVRPPGHHARPGNGMGFCVFNNVAIAARYLQRRHRLERILIVDWDVHHGNGTQDAFYDDPSVLYVSLHRYPFYPGTGGPEERGRGEGAGATVNVPLRWGTEGGAFVEAFEEALTAAAERFRPDFVLVSAGFDGHCDDPLGGLRLTDDDFAALARLVREAADGCCEGRLVAALEGGYHLAALARSVAAVLRALMA